MFTYKKIAFAAVLALITSFAAPSFATPTYVPGAAPALKTMASDRCRAAAK